MSSATAAHVKKLDAEFAKHCKGKPASGRSGQDVVDQLLKAHCNSDGSSLTAAYKAQFRAICLNVANIAPLIHSGDITAAALATMPTPEMASAQARHEAAEIRKEEIAYGEHTLPQDSVTTCNTTQGRHTDGGRQRTVRALWAHEDGHS